jgi:hypothetical protein
MYMIRGSLLPYPSQYYLYMLYTTVQFFNSNILLCMFVPSTTLRAQATVDEALRIEQSESKLHVLE